MQPLSLHNKEIQANRKNWQKKPLLRKVYKDFYLELKKWLAHSQAGGTVEIGSGIGQVKQAIPDCLSTDLFPNPWIDRVENIYSLNFSDQSLDNLILFDVLHHLKYPNIAFGEISRVLRTGGRALIFEPDMSLLGLLVYGLLHKEPLGWKEDIFKTAPKDFDPDDLGYFAAQSFCYRIFISSNGHGLFKNFSLVTTQRISSLAYLASGGFSGPQLYPLKLYPVLKSLDKFLSSFPALFSARMLVVLEKKQSNL